MARQSTCASCGVATGDLKQWRPDAPVDSITVCGDCSRPLDSLNSRLTAGDKAVYDLQALHGEVERRTEERDDALHEVELLTQQLNQLRVQSDELRGQLQSASAANGSGRRPGRPRKTATLNPDAQGPTHVTLPSLPGLLPPTEQLVADQLPIQPSPTRRGRPPRDPAALYGTPTPVSVPNPWEAEGLTALEWALRQAMAAGLLPGVTPGALEVPIRQALDRIAIYGDTNATPYPPEPEPALADHQLTSHPLAPPPSPPTAPGRGAKVRRG